MPVRRAAAAPHQGRQSIGKRAGRAGGSKILARHDEESDPFEASSPPADTGARSDRQFLDDSASDASLDAFLADVGLDDGLPPAESLSAAGRQPEAIEGARAGGQTEQELSIPPRLLTRLLHEHFKRKKSRLTKAADAALAKYVDVFIREAIARAAAERGEGFLEVEDLEKISPQLLLDL